jgi:hypothetical protein
MPKAGQRLSQQKTQTQRLPDRAVRLLHSGGSPYCYASKRNLAACWRDP